MLGCRIFGDMLTGPVCHWISFEAAKDTAGCHAFITGGIKLPEKLLFMDVDGTLTDGKLYISPIGECFKSFNAKDGYGIHTLLPQYGIRPIIITGRSSEIVENRAKELGIETVYQGVADKAACVQEIAMAFQLSAENMAFIGDDLNDLQAMKLCGAKGCPRDSAAAVKEICNYVCQKQGGDGAVREFIEWLIKNF